MKVLWLCNIVLPEFSERFGFRKVNVGGWLTGMWNELKKSPDIELGICLPIRDEARMKDGDTGECKYYSFHYVQEEDQLEKQVSDFLKIIGDFRPDVIHIWGTEYQHTYAMLQACQKADLLDKVVINIQGLLHICAKHYANELSKELIEKNIDGQSIQNEIDEFISRSTYEKNSLNVAKHVVGRTMWDKACVMQINPSLNYYHCNEILRPVFYEKRGTWKYENCEKYTIFVSQANYPLKGFHVFLKALAIIKERYPQVKVYVAGVPVIDLSTTYAEYIREYITTLQLEENIEFLGLQTEEKMCEYYQKCNVFVSASSIENSPNSICEAGMIGTPIVASFVGGVPDLIKHQEEGLLYPFDAEYMLAHYVSYLFENQEACRVLSKNASLKMSKLNDVDINSKATIEIYKNINLTER